MTYSTLLDMEGQAHQYLVVLQPRALMATWTAVSGTKYKQAFTLGEIIIVNDNGTDKTKATDSTLSDGDWFHDLDDDFLYFDDGQDPSLFDVVVTYEIYLGTFDANFYRDPTDSTTRQVYYEPLIQKAPTFTQSTSDDLYGYLVTSSSSIIISNATHFMQQHVYASSFNNAKIQIYHYIDKLKIANIKQVASLYCGNVRYTDTETTIEVFDGRVLFGKQYRHASGDDFYLGSRFPKTVDPDYIGKPIRRVFGVSDRFIPVNVDYDETATGTVNRVYGCVHYDISTDLQYVETTVSGSSSTTTRTYLTSADGFRVGDTFVIRGASGSSGIVTGVNKTGSHYIDHAAGLKAPAIAGADTDPVERAFISSVTLVRDGEPPITLLYKYHYDIIFYSTPKVASIILNDNIETTTLVTDGEWFGSGSAYIEPSDLVYCQIYGEQVDEYLGGSSFGSNSANTGNLAQAIVILYSILKNSVGLAESELDLTTFTSLQASVTDEIGFTLPKSGFDEFPLYRDLIAEILQTLLIKIVIDDDNKFTLKQVGPLSAADRSIADDEILLNSFEQSFDYKDIISDTIVEYAAKEVSQRFRASEIYYSRVTAESSIAKNLHNRSKEKTFKSLHFTAAEAQTLADRLSYIWGERQGRIRVGSKNTYLDTELEEVITITRDRQPGFAYVDGTDQSRDGVAIGTNKGLNTISIELDDQKGIEDNSASW